MPFQKDIETASGIVAKHWRIAALRIDYRARTLFVTVCGYATKAAFLGGKSPLASFDEAYVGDAFPLLENQNQNVTKAIEAKLLADPFFAGSVAD